MLRKFIETCETNGIDIHQMTCYKNNKLLFNFAIPPYSTNDKQQLYSLSKSFTSTGIGFAVAEGLLTVNDKIADIFADELIDCELSDYAKNLTVQDCLTMRTGHNECSMGDILNSDSPPIVAFMTKTFGHEPGTYFIYNTGSTYILSAVITKLTGDTLFDYLTPRLFEPLGIKNAYWGKFKDVTEGGYGLHVSSYDAAQLGLLYYNKGVYNGKRLLSEEWVNEATHGHADTGATGGTLDWGAGYGYQFWRCYRGGYRGDGAYGQLCVIKDDIVFTMLTEVGDMQKEMDFVTAFLDEIKDDSVFNVNNIPVKSTPVNSDRVSSIYMNRWLHCGENPFGMRKIKFTVDYDTVTLYVSYGDYIHEIKCGIGRWINNDVNSMVVAACYTGDEIIWRYKNMPHKHTFKLNEISGGIEITAISITNPPHVFKLS